MIDWTLNKTANVLENLYLLFLFIIVIFSTTLSIDSADIGFRVCSIIMGLFTLVMIYWSIEFAFKNTIASISIIFLAFYILTFILPLIMNVRHLKIWDFLKGVVFSIYLAPTYINIFTIYAISNIHDVTWGSRPTTQTQKSNEVEKQKKSKYKNYRAKFLIVWIMSNVAVGSALVYMARNEQYLIMFGIAAFLMFVMVMKILFASLYWLKAKNDRRRAYKMLRKRSSKVFSNVNQNAYGGNIIYWLCLENAFETYEIASDSGIILRSHFDNEANGDFIASVVLFHCY